MYNFSDLQNLPEQDAEFALGFLQRLGARVKADVATTGNVLKDIVTGDAWRDPEKNKSWTDLNEGYRQANQRARDSYNAANEASIDREMRKTASDTSLRDVRTGEPYEARAPKSETNIVKAAPGGEITSIDSDTAADKILKTPVNRRNLMGGALATAATIGIGSVSAGRLLADLADKAGSPAVEAAGEIGKVAGRMGKAAQLPMALDKIDDITNNTSMSRRKFLQKYGLVLKEAARQVAPKAIKAGEIVTGSDAVTNVAVNQAKKFIRRRFR